MRWDAGYTLVEMLAALAVIGMAFAGLAAGSHILLRQQRSATLDVASAETLSTAQASLDAALASVKLDDILFADARRIEISCPVGERCGAATAEAEGGVLVNRTGPDHVAMTAARGFSFSYETAAGPAARWARDSRDALTAISLTTDKARATPVAVWRPRQEQAFRCEYDVVIASCREPAP